VRFEIGGVGRSTEFVVVIDQRQFDGLAKEMLKAHPEAAIRAFRAAPAASDHG
jgi:hypothetical protein